MQNSPKPKMVIDGVPWWDWLYSYQHDGATYNFAICATSREDADERLRKMSFAQFLGQADGEPLPLASPTVGAWMMTAAENIKRLLGL